MAEEHMRITLVTCAIFFFVGTVFYFYVFKSKLLTCTIENSARWAKFFYVSFLKPHTGDHGGGQQGALESFYKSQVRDAERCALLN